MTEPFDLLVLNLRGEIPPSSKDFLVKEQAYKTLKAMSGEDLGYDADAWSEHKQAIMKRFKGSLRKLGWRGGRKQRRSRT